MLELIGTLEQNGGTLYRFPLVMARKQKVKTIVDPNTSSKGNRKGQTQELHREAGVAEGACGLEELSRTALK